MRNQLTDFICVLALILVGPVVWFFFDLGTALGVSLVMAIAARIVMVLAMIVCKHGDRKGNRNHLIALLVYLAGFLLVLSR